MAEPPGLASGLKSYSCLTCRQRKVKCDRRNPCANCVKAEQQCSFVQPVRGKRKRTKAPKEGIHAKLRRYEALLKSYGAKIEPSEYDNESDSATVSQPDVDIVGDVTPRSRTDLGSLALENIEPKLINKEGSSRYFDSALGSNFGGEFPYPEEDGVVEPTDESNIRDSDLFVGSLEHYGLAPHAHSKIENLASLHPPHHILLKLWDIYVDRVDPLMKILHLPTFWSSLTNALQHPEDVSKSLEALIFGFYLATITSLEEDECQILLGGQKSIIFARHELAARRALTAAGFLHTSSPMTLGAYVMFIMGVRCNRRCDTLFVLVGVAVRLGRKMGLHRDGSSLGLSPFETEMRRRLWWHIVHLDIRASDLLSARPSLDLFSGDAKLPLNVIDDDLSPDMADLPPERTGITSIVVCLIRCEIGQFLRKFSSTSPGEFSWEILTNPSVSLAKKDSMINQLEDLLERKFLRYCDPSNTLHYFASIMVRSGICKIKLYAHNPRGCNHGIKLPQSERDIIFANAMKLLEYTNLVGGNRNLDKYMWPIGVGFLWNSLLFVLIEARHRKIGPEMDRLWKLIGDVLSKYPQMFEKNTGAVYAALGKWTLEAWDDYITTVKVEGIPEPPTPEYINAIRRCRTPSVEFSSNQKDSTDFGPTTGKSTGSSNTQPRKQDRSFLFDLEPFTAHDFPDLLSFESDPNEWIQWESLVVEEGSAQNDII